jgi:thiol-disulfide isomerase/thioredoxin
MMKLKSLFAAAILSVIPSLVSSQSQLLNAGIAAPDWALKDASGNIHRLSDYRGKLVLLDFWATWCGPCKLEMPEIQAIYKEYGAKGVVVIGLNTWETSDPAKFMKDNGYSYSLLLNADNVAKAYQVEAIPALYLIDKNGIIYYSRLGYLGDKSLTDKVAAYLKAMK